ncbi:hypothetical protein [Marivirga sp.]|uniref:hypothetical protein n=1 Tax=Marivirga sp. TaxID=2018662 RepID=UPI003DA727C7
MKFIKWFSASLEGADGKLSSKKVSILACLTFLLFMILFTASVKKEHPTANQVFPDIAWIVVAGGAVGFSTNQVVQSIKQNHSQKSDNRYSEMKPPEQMHKY